MHNNLKQRQLCLDLEESDQKWVQLLCSLGCTDEFALIIQESKCDTLAIMKYRRILRSRGIADIPLIKLNTAYINKNNEELHRLLEYMFLEFISVKQFNYIIEKINKNENSLLKLYDRHLEDIDTRIISLITTL